MKLKKKQIKIITIFFILCFFIIPTNVFADISQNIDNTSSQITGISSYIQKLGTGLSGTFNNYQLKYTIPLAKTFNNTIYSGLYCYTDSSYTTHCTNDYATSGGVWLTTDIITTGTTGTLTINFSTTTSHTLDPTKYYQFKTYTNESFISMLGSATNVYKTSAENLQVEGSGTGYIYVNDTNVLDIYFILQNYIETIPTTNIYSITPINNSIVATSTDFVFEVKGYIKDSDFSTSTTKIILNAEIRNQFHDYSNPSYNIDMFAKKITWVATSSGAFDFSTTTSITNDVSIGMWNITTKIVNPAISIGNLDLVGDIFGYNLGKTFTSTTTTFTIATTTQADKYFQEIQKVTAGLSYINNGFNCQMDFNNLFSFSNFKQCMGFLFTPDFRQIDKAIESEKETVFNSFPLGYATDFIRIISSTTTPLYPTLTATLPTALGLGNPTLTLSTKGALDFVLNANGGKFTDNSETFYQITDYYWRLVVYLFAILYMLRRILGIHFEISPFTDKFREPYKNKKPKWRKEEKEYMYKKKTKNETKRKLEKKWGEDYFK